MDCAHIFGAGAVNRYNGTFRRFPGYFRFNTWFLPPRTKATFQRESTRPCFLPGRKTHIAYLSKYNCWFAPAQSVSSFSCYFDLRSSVFTVALIIRLVLTSIQLLLSVQTTDKSDYAYGPGSYFPPRMTPRYFCSRCQAGFASQMTYRAHYAMSLNHHLCNFCGFKKDLTTFAALQLHLDDDHLYCEPCNWFAPSTLGLRQHNIWKHHMCGACGDFFSNAHELNGVGNHSHNPQPKGDGA